MCDDSTTPGGNGSSAGIPECLEWLRVKKVGVVQSVGLGPRFGEALYLSTRLLRVQSEAVHNSDLSHVESMLFTQANTLGMVFSHPARKAAFSEYLNQFHAHLRWRSRHRRNAARPLEALAGIKNPRGG
ncbi:hypothetical protein [Burkholderia sp. WSM2232]|uniref:hypothetical protein n=1 Tax=Burkholderia sp. WSM2232 TaxID=944436 RepID=UPI0006863CC5|nr:hypothetical protein [Burkholderia sp. WSM2232]